VIVTSGTNSTGCVRTWSRRRQPGRGHASIPGGPSAVTPHPPPTRGPDRPLALRHSRYGRASSPTERDRAGSPRPGGVASGVASCSRSASWRGPHHRRQPDGPQVRSRLAQLHLRLALCAIVLAPRWCWRNAAPGALPVAADRVGCAAVAASPPGWSPAGIRSRCAAPRNGCGLAGDYSLGSCSGLTRWPPTSRPRTTTRRCS